MRLLPFACCLLAFAFAIPFSAAAVPAGSCDWQAVPYRYPGVRAIEITDLSPRPANAYALRIELDTAGLDFYTTPRVDNWSANDTETRRATTRRFLRDARAAGRTTVAAINAAPWTPWPQPFADEGLVDLQGLAVSEGVLVSPGTGAPAFIYREDGTAEIASAGPDFDISGVDTAVAGFSLCLTAGVPASSGTDLAPRTGIGLSQDRRVVILLVVDGRRHASQGATVAEVGEWLRYFGAWDGINLDGGGSSTMAVWDELATGEEKALLLNNPVGNGFNWLQFDPSLEASAYTPTERTNGNNLGVEVDFLRLTQQPAGGDVTLGEGFSLSVASTGARGTLRYTWLKEGVPVPGALDAPFFQVAAARLADAGEYRCRVQDDYLTVLSNPALVTVSTPTPAAGPLALAALVAAVTLVAVRRRL